MPPSSTRNSPEVGSERGTSFFGKGKFGHSDHPWCPISYVTASWSHVCAHAMVVPRAPHEARLRRGRALKDRCHSQGKVRFTVSFTRQG